MLDQLVGSPSLPFSFSRAGSHFQAARHLQEPLYFTLACLPMVVSLYPSGPAALTIQGPAENWRGFGSGVARGDWPPWGRPQVASGCGSQGWDVSSPGLNHPTPRNQFVRTIPSRGTLRCPYSLKSLTLQPLTTFGEICKGCKASNTKNFMDKSRKSFRKVPLQPYSPCPFR